MTAPTPIPPHLASFPWYAPHLAWLRTLGRATRHDPGDAAPRCADLSNADLSRASLSNADLSRASLSRASLSGADLFGASLIGADLSNADLSGADLSGASLYRASLSGAGLSGADLSEARGIVSVGPVGAERRIVYGVRHADRIMVQAGCSWRSLDDTRAAVLARYADGSGRERHRAGYLAALDAIAAILGGAA